METQMLLTHRFMRRQRSQTLLNSSKVRRFSQQMTQLEVCLNNSNKIKVSSLMLWEKSFSDTRSVNLNVLLKEKKREAYLLQLMEILISAPRISIIKNYLKDLQFNAVSRDLSFQVDKSSALLSLVPL